MKKIGIIGAGTMGCGTAQSFAQEGFSVILLDISEQILEASKQNIYHNCRLRALFHKGDMTHTPEETIANIKFSRDYQLLEDVDYVIENVPEQWGIKKSVYPKIDEICPSHCIFLVNTSCISITKVAGLTQRPSQVIGVHFMNPVPLKSTVEVIRGFHTSEETERSVINVLREIGKESIVVNDFPGFVSNRISHLYFNEAAYVVQDGVATPQQVDELFKKCFGHKMGPLETADLIGLDTVLDSLNILYESYQDPKFRCCPLLQKMVDAGLLGRKSGRGFHVYES